VQWVIPARDEGTKIAAEGSQSMHEYDKASRYMIKQDPAGFFRWLWRHADTPLQFHSWLDARRSALPDERDLTCDTVAAFRLPSEAEPSYALIVEFMAESRSNTLTRMLAYVLRARTEPPTAEGQELPPQLGGVVINPTGKAQPREVQVTFPEVPECNWSFGVLQRTLRDVSAADTLLDIAAGKTTRWLLQWIPLMQGGGEMIIMEQWKQEGLAEPDTHVRSTLGSFALNFADLAGRSELWEQALEGWDMQNSQVVDRWQEKGRVEGRAEGRLEARRDDLQALLESRFGSLPEELIERIRAVQDAQRLHQAFQQALKLQSLAELQL
jgi:hypothetical protein